MKREILGQPRDDRGEIIVEDMVTNNVLEKQVMNISKPTDVLNVLNKQFFTLNNTTPKTLTDFIKGSLGQRIYILGDGNTTVQHGTNIFTNTGMNKLLENNKVYKFTLFKPTLSTHKWVEDA